MGDGGMKDEEVQGRAEINKLTYQCLRHRAYLRSIKV
jgi:hypothetical protein